MKEIVFRFATVGTIIYLDAIYILRFLDNADKYVINEILGMK